MGRVLRSGKSLDDSNATSEAKKHAETSFAVSQSISTLQDADTAITLPNFGNRQRTVKASVDTSFPSALSSKPSIFIGKDYPAPFSVKQREMETLEPSSLANTASKFVLPVASHVRRPRPRPQPQPIFKPTTITTLTYERSVEITRISITALVSMITFFKKAFGNNHVFEHRYFDPNDPNLTYEAFKKGVHKIQQQPGDPEILNHWLIAAGKSEAADKLLSWLEHDTVHAAIEGKYLSNIELRLHYRHNVESYFISLTYCEGSERPRIEARLGGTGEDVPSMVVYDAQAQLYALMEDVNRQLQLSVRSHDGHLKKGPNYITMGVILNDKAPKELHIPGFKRSLTRPLNLNNISPVECSTMKTPFHSVSVNPPDYNSLVTRSAEQATRRTIIDHGPTAARKNDTDDTEDTEEAVASPCTLRMQGSDTASVASEDYPHTQFENVSLIKNLGPSRKIDPATQDTLILPRSLQSPTSHSFSNTNTLRQSSDIPNIRGIIPARINENISDDDGNMDGNLQDEDLDIPLSPVSEILCECRASDYVPGCMIKCLSCDKYHHSFCYAYLNPPSSHIMEELCYECDDEVTEPPDMRLKLCLLRRTIYVLRNGQILNVTEVFDFMMIEDSQASTIQEFCTCLLNFLRILGLVQLAQPQADGRDALFYLSSSNDQLPKWLFNPRLFLTAILNDNPRLKDHFQSGEFGLSLAAAVWPAEFADNPNSKATDTLNSKAKLERSHSLTMSPKSASFNPSSADCDGTKCGKRKLREDGSPVRAKKAYESHSKGWKSIHQRGLS
ncbi:hypothetical protein GLAREA_04547 [Glarea lozoyensis ATCC 20868]|uniref:HORMA domain-containing protein n=1 Tax=Glarea lozoyensis (strain ATCC 20868 / MF5171) TaxID=1116229 RepID=S3D6Y0_GLAL2|nr:uncharacterized protein GLAREA_04547 [Glarea lozoyensis ATCC 20868]EPE27756.1 hypothetical protein GLAREA_04547 [Glarea lozoyensis ATCC 20868]